MIGRLNARCTDLLDTSTSGFLHVLLVDRLTGGMHRSLHLHMQLHCVLVDLNDDVYKCRDNNNNDTLLSLK